MGISMLPSHITRIITLVLRVLTAAILITSFVIIATIAQTVNVLNEHKETRRTFIMRFYDVVPFRYTVATVIIGAVYSIFQIVHSVIRLSKGNDGNVRLDFYGEEVMSKLLASGAAAGFVGSAELIKTWEELNGAKEATESFMNKSYSANALVLLGFFCSFALSVLSSYALARSD